MAELPGYICLETIVDQVNSDLFNGARGRYFQLLNWVVRGALQLKMNVLIDKKTIKIEVQDEPYCVILPNDFVKFHAIGTVSHTKFIPFGKTIGRTTTTTEDCGQETQNTDEIAQQGTGVTEIRYIPTYTYTLDEHNNRILIDGFPKLTEAVLIYQSTGINTGKETYVPIKAQEALIAYVHLQIASHTTKTNFDYQTALQRYQREVNLLGKMQISVKNLYEIARDVLLSKTLA